ncbi:Ssl1-like-domain-containing protein [Pisolithus marmoratus]|nr:Ssl1-like-domain-containing protein [Pisolithus marmoratus]
MDVDSDSDISLFGDEDPRAKGKSKGKASRKAEEGESKKKDKGAYTWEASYTRSWDTVQEDETGSLQGAVEDLMARGRRRRYTAAPYSLHLPPPYGARSSVHLVLILDLSNSMMDRDFRPTRFDLTLRYAREFVTEWFDQNPLGQIGVVGMRSGLGERVGEMSGNPQDPAGEPSLAECDRDGKRQHESSREILIVFGSLTTCDPGNIHETLEVCIKSRIRISEMKICRELSDKTGGKRGCAQGNSELPMNEGHFKDLLFELVPPPAQQATIRSAGSGIGNPPCGSDDDGLSDTASGHSEGFLCPRCLAKVCDVPTDCDICGLMIVSSPHLARSYHHLFPVKPYEAVASLGDTSESANACHACARPFPAAHSSGIVTEGISPLGRYRCPDCHHDFCTECDVFVHDVVHCCPGCGK